MRYINIYYSNMRCTDITITVVANIQEEDSKEQLWIQLNHLFNNRGSCLSHTTDTV